MHFHIHLPVTLSGCSQYCSASSLKSEIIILSILYSIIKIILFREFHLT